MTLRVVDTPAVFLDRDGVICHNRPDHVKSWSEFSFIEGSIEAMASLTRAGARLFIASNQAQIGRGLVTPRMVDTVHEHMLDVLAGAGVKIEAVLVCPHHPDDGCACRKPEPGMLLDAAVRAHIDLSRSVMVGDYVTDIDAGTRAGCETVLVRTGRGNDSLRAWQGPKPTFVANDLVDAAIWILGRQAMRMRAGSRALTGGEGHRR